MREPQNISQLLELKPDFMGMIFYHKSPRFVDFNLCPSETLVQKFPSVKKVGVFVNQTVDEILSIVAKFNLDVVQLHGSETPDECGIFKQKGISVFKAFGISTKEDLEKLESYKDVVEKFVLDTKTESYGGSGKKFNWTILNEFSVPKPFLLSGGIGLEDIETVTKLKINNMAGIDLNSKFEISPALKDIAKLKDVFKKCKIN